MSKPPFFSSFSKEKVPFGMSQMEIFSTFSLSKNFPVAFLSLTFFTKEVFCSSTPVTAVPLEVLNLVN